MARAERGAAALGAFAAAAIMAGLTALGAVPELTGPEPLEVPFPTGERLTYSVSWMGLTCGAMEIRSFLEGPPGDPTEYRIVVLARTTPFFDGIYRVRSRLDSFVDPKRMSSVRYEERALEKKKRKEDIWVVSEDRAEVVRTKNGTTTRIPIEVERAFDPLAFIFNLRTMELAPGEEKALGLMTSRGAVETVARVTESKKIKTGTGRCDALAVVPEPRDKMMFSKSGRMVVWIGREPPHPLCRIEFDLSFGTLVATLKDSTSVEGAAGIPDWETWQADGAGED